MGAACFLHAVLHHITGVFSLLGAAEITDGVHYPIGGFQKVGQGCEGRLVPATCCSSSLLASVASSSHSMRAAAQLSCQLWSWIIPSSCTGLHCPQQVVKALESLAISSGVSIRTGDLPAQQGSPCIWQTRDPVHVSCTQCRAHGVCGFALPPS